MFWRSKRIVLILALVLVITFYVSQHHLIAIDIVDSVKRGDFAKPIYRYMWGANVSSCAGEKKDEINPMDEIKRVTIAMAICNQSVAQGITAVKSMIVFSTRLILDLRIFYDHITLPQLQRELPALQKHSRRFNVTLEFHLYLSTYPTSDDDPPWMQLYKTCAAQRLFYAALLTDVDAVIHVDTDVVFLSDVRELWGFFLQMNATQLAGMTHHDELSGVGTYSHTPPERTVPYYGQRGVQDGVMLQNLTRLRAVDFQAHMNPIYKAYSKRIVSDQCLVNAYFHFHPEQMFLIPCAFNLISTHCDVRFHRGECVSAKETGIAVVHGAGGRFEAKHVGAFFRHFYAAFLETNLAEDTVHNVANRIYRGFYTITPKTVCSAAVVSVLRRVKKYL